MEIHRERVPTYMGRLSPIVLFLSIPDHHTRFQPKAT
jgi:hypothetical protein